MVCKLRKKIFRSSVDGTYSLSIKGMNKETISVLLDLLSNMVDDGPFVEYSDGIQLPMLSVSSSVRMSSVGKNVFSTPNFVLKQISSLFNKNTDIRAIDKLYSFTYCNLKSLSNGK